MTIPLAVVLAVVLLVSCGKLVARTTALQSGALVKWANVQTTVGSSISFSSVTDGPGTWTKFTAVGPSPGSSGTDRAERVADRSERVGDHSPPTEYSWDMLISTPITLLNTESWMILTQWHQDYRSCPPNVALRISKPVAEPQPILELILRGGILNKKTCKAQYSYTAKLKDVKVGETTHIDARFIWSTDRKVAVSVVCVDGEDRASLINVPNLYEGMQAYMKQGIYRSRSPTRDVVLMSPVEVTRQPEYLRRNEAVGSC